MTNFSSSTVTHSRTSEISNAHVCDLVRVEIPVPCVKYRESLESFESSSAFQKTRLDIPVNISEL